MQYIIYSLTIVFIFVLFKMLEFKVSKEENKDVKSIVKESIIVLISSLGAILIVDQINPLSLIGGNAPNAFLNDPEF